MLLLVFSYDTRDPEQFERAYGPDGEWAQFFRLGRGYVGTELLRDTKSRERYLVIDRWESRQAYLEFMSEQRAEYVRRSEETRHYYERELSFGTFENPR